MTALCYIESKMVIPYTWEISGKIINKASAKAKELITMAKDSDVFSNTLRILDEMERLETFEQQVSFFQQHSQDKRQLALPISVLPMLNKDHIVADKNRNSMIEIGNFRTKDNLICTVIANAKAQRELDELRMLLSDIKKHPAVPFEHQSLNRLSNDIKIGIRFLCVGKSCLPIMSGTEYEISFDDFSQLIKVGSNYGESGMQWIKPERFEY